MSEVPSTENSSKKKQQQEEEYLKINCRMYKAEYPQVNDLVMVQYKY